MEYSRKGWLKVNKGVVFKGSVEEGMGTWLKTEKNVLIEVIS
jgi:hypothetical protein